MDGGVRKQNKVSGSAVLEEQNSWKWGAVARREKGKVDRRRRGLE